MRAALSTSRALLRRLDGRERVGVALGRRQVDFGGYVLSLTPPGTPRMPNGVEVDLRLAPGDEVGYAGTELVAGGEAITCGRICDPVPARLPPVAGAPRAEGLLAKVGLGEGLTPYWDDVLAGYLAGLVLLHNRRAEAEAIADLARPRTSSLSSTLLLHAAHGEVPEPVHAFLASADREPLLAFGHTSGRGWLEGLERAGCPAASGS